jgi:hypothetical protein
MDHADLAAPVTARLVEQIHAGTGSWRMPWHVVPDLLDALKAVAPTNRHTWHRLHLEAVDANHTVGR